MQNLESWHSCECSLTHKTLNIALDKVPPLKATQCLMAIIRPVYITKKHSGTGLQITPGNNSVRHAATNPIHEGPTEVMSKQVQPSLICDGAFVNCNFSGTSHVYWIRCGSEEFRGRSKTEKLVMFLRQFLWWCWSTRLLGSQWGVPLSKMMWLVYNGFWDGWMAGSRIS